MPRFNSGVLQRREAIILPGCYYPDVFINNNKRAGNNHDQTSGKVADYGHHWLRHYTVAPGSGQRKNTEYLQLLMKVRPYVSYFHSSRYISDLANGDICVAIGWSGDVLQASDRADEADNGVVVEYTIPKEGAGMWFYMLAIPKDAENVDEAYVFLNYLLKPQVIAQISNCIAYACPNKSSVALVDEEIRKNPGIYPTEEARKNLYVFAVLPPKVDRIINRSFTKVTSGY